MDEVYVLYVTTASASGASKHSSLQAAQQQFAQLCKLWGTKLDSNGWVQQQQHFWVAQTLDGRTAQITN